MSGSITVRLGGRPVVVACPERRDLASLSTDMLAMLARARCEGAAAYLLRGSPGTDEPLCDLVSDEVQVLRPGRFARRVLSLRCGFAGRMGEGRRRVSRARASFWLEVHKELRRHVGDQRVPYPLRVRLRAAADRSRARAATATESTSRLPRRLLVGRVRTDIGEPALTRARAEAARAGVGGGPLVALEVGSHADLYVQSIEYLVGRGFTVVRLGDPSRGPLTRPGVVDLACGAAGSALAELFALRGSRFVICESLGLQRLADLTNTPCLRVNTVDPFEAYPLRDDGLYLLKTAVDLQTGEALAPRDRVTERRLRNLRNYGYRDNTAFEILAGTREMLDGLEQGWADSPGQASFRDHATAAARTRGWPTTDSWGTGGSLDVRRRDAGEPNPVRDAASRLHPVLRRGPAFAGGRGSSRARRLRERARQAGRR